MELHTIKFPHAEDYLAELSTKAKAVLWSDPNIYQVKAALKETKDARLAIEKTGKAMRDTATAYSREVMDTQRKLVWYIQEDEKSLKAKKDELEHYEKLDKNHHKLEPRKAELANYDYEHEDVEELILMTETQYKKLLENRKEVYLLKKEKELADKQKEMEIAEAVQEAKAEVKQEIQEEEQQQEQAKIEQKEQLDSNAKFQNQLLKNWYNPATDKYKVKDGVCTVYRIISTFTI